MNSQPDEATPLVVNVRTAIVDGIKIHSCGECTHNYARTAIPLFPPTHYCNSRVDARANDAIIFNPRDIPDECPYLVQGRKPEHVFLDPQGNVDVKATSMFEGVWILKSILLMMIAAMASMLFFHYPNITASDIIFAVVEAVLLGIIMSPFTKWIAMNFWRKPA